MMLIMIIDGENFVLLSMLVLVCLVDDTMKIVEKFLLILWAMLKTMGTNDFPEKRLLVYVMNGEGIAKSLLKVYCTADVV